MLKHTFVFVFLITAFTQVAFAKNADCPSELLSNPPSQQASVFLRVDRTTYPINGSMVIDAGIINKGDNPIYVYDWLSWGFGGGLVIRLRDEHGKELLPVLRDDTMLPPPPTRDDSKIFVRLRDPGDFFGTQRRIAVKDLVKSAGKYTLQIEYRSPLSCKFVGKKLGKLPALWHEDAGIFSQQISFQVTK